MSVRVGIVGAGANAKGHAAALDKIEGAAVSFVHDVDETRAAQLARTHGAAVAGDLDELIAGSDAIYVCSWTAAHPGAVVPAAAASRAIFCEKPLATNVADAEAMVRAVAASGVVNQVGLPLRWVPAFAILRQLLTDPESGAVITATLHSDIPSRSRALSSWRGDTAVAGGGMLVEVGFHDLDMLRWLVGPVTSLGAFTVPAGDRERVEDGASVSMGLEDGGLATLVAVWHDAPHRPQTRRLQIVCERAHYLLEIEPSSCQLNVCGPGDRHQVFDRDDLTELAAHFDIPSDPAARFIRSVTDQTPAAPGFADALDVHLLIDAAYRSARTGSREQLQDAVAPGREQPTPSGLRSGHA